MDFFAKSLRKEETCAVLVKAEKNSGKMVAEALEKKKADYILYTKGDTKIKTICCAADGAGACPLFFAILAFTEF